MQNIGPIVRRVLWFAAVQHAHQIRRLKPAELRPYFKERHMDGLPYIVHLTGVAIDLALKRFDEVTICAALLHDVLEDCPWIEEEAIERLFGQQIAQMVKALSYVKSDGSITAQREKYYGRLTSIEIVAIALADVNDNSFSFLMSLTDPPDPDETEPPFERLKTTPQDELNHWRAVVEIAAKYEGDSRIRALVEQVVPNIKAVQAKVDQGMVTVG